jgi:hypothetical protein
MIFAIFLSYHSSFIAWWRQSHLCDSLMAWHVPCTTALWLWKKWFSPILQTTRGMTSKWFHVVHNRYITIFMVHNITEIIQFPIGNVAYVATVFFKLILRYSTALDFYLCPLFLRELGFFTHAPLFSKRYCPSFSRAETGCTLLSRNTLRQQHTCCGICCHLHDL